MQLNIKVPFVVDFGPIFFGFGRSRRTTEEKTTRPTRPNKKKNTHTNNLLSNNLPDRLLFQISTMREVFNTFQYFSGAAVSAPQGNTQEQTGSMSQQTAKASILFNTYQDTIIILILLDQKREQHALGHTAYVTIAHNNRRNLRGSMTGVIYWKFGGLIV